MRQTLSRGVFAAAAATSLLTLCGSSALADSQAEGAASNSPGVLSGNTIQAPVSVPVNVCGNTVDVVAVLNPAFGNSCGNGSPVTTPVTVPAPPSVTPSTDDGSTALPPVSTPTPTPDSGTSTTDTPPRVVDEAVAEPQHAQTLPAPAVLENATPDAAPQLAETGTGALLASSAASAALIAGGVILYRRGRAATHR
ncbi:chaplin [Streptomyces sp. NPDC056112]|uniref:chaplin n=1 Tax=unclassified Streptomyces TaxID=2593676 RepID=UPI001CD21A76|nr:MULTISPECIES: chaplin [unclassified Streptomyces]